MNNKFGIKNYEALPVSINGKKRNSTKYNAFLEKML